MRISPDPYAPLTEAAMKVVVGSLPGQPLVARSALDTMLAAERRGLSTLSGSARRVVAAGMIRARVYSAMSDDAVEIADSEAESAPPALASGLHPATRSACHSVLSEAYLTGGRTSDGNRHARRAEDYAVEADDDACRYRATALLASNLALNGEFRRAADASARTHAIENQYRWPRNTSALPLVLADIIIAYSRLDADALEIVCDELTVGPSQGPIWVAFGQLATGWLYMLRQQYDRALAAVESLTSGSDSELIPELIRGFAFSLQAMALVHRGEPNRALNLLTGRVSPSSHALCFDMHRATAHLQLQENREAMQTTEGCLRLGAGHNLRTLASVLLRRAVANDRLGHQLAADNAFAEAFHIMHRDGALTPLLGLPGDELDALLIRFVEAQPEMTAAVAQLRVSARTRPRSTTPEYVPPKLTARESVVAHWLRTEYPLSVIAARLHVSSNTLKSQVRSIYVKIGATSREQAIARLERSGFYDRSPSVR